MKQLSVLIITLSLFVALFVGVGSATEAHPKPPCLHRYCHPTATLTVTPRPTATKTPARKWPTQVCDPFACRPTPRPTNSNCKGNVCPYNTPTKVK